MKYLRTYNLERFPTYSQYVTIAFSTRNLELIFDDIFSSRERIF